VGACAADQVCVWSECRNVSGWVPPIPADRDAVTEYLAARVDPDVVIHDVEADPDAGGWCHYDAVVDPRKGKPALYIQNNTDGDLLVDDAVIKRAPATMSLKAYHGPPTAELDQARESFRRLRGPHDPPPNAARRAYEQRRRP